MANHRRVLLIIESSRAYGRGCLSGIAAYIRAHEPWQVLHLERSLVEALPAVLRSWRGDGILARIETPQMVRAIRSMRLPTVDLRGAHELPGMAVLDTDSTACARLAVNHFLERGFRNLAYCGFPGLDFSDKRSQAFERCARSADCPPAIFERPEEPPSRLDTISRETHGETHIAEITAWLLALPRPVGVFACNDVRGRQVLQAASQADLQVPDEVSVLGVDNDIVVCDLSNPSLSSIEPDTHRIGYRGAEILDRMIAGEPAPRGPVLAPPVGIIPRRSTEAVAIDDEQIVRAIRFIREHACENIGVEDVVQAAMVSRATLERRFAQYLRRTPRCEIERVRLERVRRLLTETDYTLAHIAELTAFRSASHLATVFRRRTGATPGAYRDQARRAR